MDMNNKPHLPELIIMSTWDINGQYDNKVCGHLYEVIEYFWIFVIRSMIFSFLLIELAVFHLFFLYLDQRSYYSLIITKEIEFVKTLTNSIVIFQHFYSMYGNIFFLLQEQFYTGNRNWCNCNDPLQHLLIDPRRILAR